MKKIIQTIVALGLTAPLLHAASITVADHSFEDGSAPNVGDWSDDLSPDWSERDGENNPNAFEEQIADFSADGTNHVGVVSGYYIWQDTGVALQPNTQYTLNIAAGNRLNQTDPTNLTTYAILAGTTNLGTVSYADTASVIADTALTLAAETWNASAGTAAGTFADAPALVFTTGDTVPAENVTIFLGADGVGRSHFDNIRLDATPIPEPSASLIGALAGLMLLRRRR